MAVATQYAPASSLTRPVRATHGTDDGRRWHQAHGNGTCCDVCWPHSGGLPPMPVGTAVYPQPVAGWLDDLIREEFGTDVPDEVAA